MMNRIKTRREKNFVDRYVDFVFGSVNCVYIDDEDRIEFFNLILDVLRHIDARERKVLLLRLGFFGRCRTLKEVASVLEYKGGSNPGIGVEATRCIERTGMRKLRHPIRASGFMPILEKIRARQDAAETAL